MDQTQQVALCAMMDPDTNLSPEARVLVSHVAVNGTDWQEIDHPTLRRLLHCSDAKIRTACKDAENAGWLERDTNTGRRPNRYRLRVSEKDTQSVRVSKNDTHTAVRVSEKDTQRRATSTSASTPSSSSASGSAREGDLSLARLRKFLAPHDEVLDRFDRSAKHDPNWPADIWSMFRPPSGAPHDGGGTEWATFAGHDEETAARVLSNAMRDYAGKGDRFSAHYFRRFVRTALRELERAARMEATGTDGRPAKRAMDDQDYDPSQNSEPDW